MTEAFPGERRHYPRRANALAVQYRHLLKPQDPFTGSLSKDISAGGLRVSAPGFLPKDTRLVVEFMLPESVKRIRAIGRVAWVEEEPASRACDFGLEFVEISPQDRQSIVGHIERGGALPVA